MENIKFKVACFMFLVSCSIPAFASSLSELNTKGFQERSTPPIRAAENPFLKRNISPEDLIAEDLNLTGIIYNTSNAYALISGYILQEGDEIAGYKIKLIERDHVVLRQLDQVKVLKLE